MPSPLLPFLYQTRTIQRVWKATPRFSTARLAHSHRGRTSTGSDNGDNHSIPFDWGDDPPPDRRPKRVISDMSYNTLQQERRTTLSPSEAHVFKRIFEEIAQGKMPPARRRERQHDEQESSSPGSAERPHSIIEHARMTEFRDRVLERYPESLRGAAYKALGMFELQPRNVDVEEMSEADKELWSERQRYHQLREDEKIRVEALMKACKSDFDLWKVMENEVFSLPGKLGIVQEVRAPAAKPGGKNAAAKAQQKKAADSEQTAGSVAANDKQQKFIMDVHGALYPHYLIRGLKLFDTAFAHPSPFAFQILPHVKLLGLTSYVLGVSTPFFSALAHMHWERFGDASSALDAIQEMNATGLYADDEVSALLGRMRDHLSSCTLGMQGPFVSAMMEAPPYDTALMQRIDDIESFVRDSIAQYQRHYGE